MKIHKLLLLTICLVCSVVLGQAADTTPPRVTLASTASEIRAATTIFLAAIASDAEGVTKVEFYRGGVKFFEDSEAPYSVAVSLGEADAGEVEFSAIAYDLAGNKGMSNIVRVSVIIGNSVNNPDSQSSSQAVLRANSDSYTALVNTLLEVALPVASGLPALKSATSLLANDTGIDSSTIVRSEVIRTSLGGEATLYTDGSFSYKPPLNVQGSSDSFSYTLSRAGQSVTGTVSIALKATQQKAKVIYVNAAASQGNGHAASPFANLNQAELASEPGDIIVLQTGSYASLNEHHISLKDGQQLLGQGKDIVVDGETLLTASNAPILLRTVNSSLVLANDVVLRGFEISRADASGRASADSSAGSGSSAIVIPASVTGSILIEDVTIRHVGGFGILVQNSAGNPDTRVESLRLNNVSIDSPGFFAIAVDDVINFSMTGGQISNLRHDPNSGGSGRGIAIEAEFDSTISISDVSVHSLGDNTKAIVISKNTPAGQSSSMTVKLDSNSLQFPDSGAEASAAIVINYSNSSTGAIELSGQGNTTNSLSPFFLSGSASSAIVGKLRINNVEFPKD